MSVPARLLVALALVLGSSLATTSCRTPAAPQAGAGSDVGLTVFSRAQQQTLPSLTGTTLTGGRLSVSTYAAGEPLVINVWASWCSPCRGEIPLLARAVHRGVRVLGIDERDDAHLALSFAASHHASYPSLSDPRGHLLASLHDLPQTGIPSTLVVAPDRRIVARVIGPLTPGTLRRILTEVTTTWPSS